MRKEKGKAIQSESDDDEIPFSELREKIIAETHGSLTEKEPTSETLQTEEDRNLEEVGTKVAKDFGSVGVFIGTVLSVEYDSDDDIKAKPFYCVEYTDGDREDLNEEEFGYAKELCFQMELDAEDEKDNNAVTSGSELL